MNLFARQEYRHRPREQTCGHSWGKERVGRTERVAQTYTHSHKSLLQHHSSRAPVLPKNIQDWSPLGWTGWISLQPKGLSRVFSNTSSKAPLLPRSVFFMVQLSHPYVTTGKSTALTRWTFVGKVMSLFFNTLSRLVIDFLPRTLESPLYCKETKTVNPKVNQSWIFIGRTGAEAEAPIL